MEIFRDGKKYYIEFQNGEAIAPLKVIGKAKNTGTQITFLPSKEIFSSIKFSANILIKRMRELAFLNKGIKIIFIDSSQKTEKLVLQTGGVTRLSCVSLEAIESRSDQ